MFATKQTANNKNIKIQFENGKPNLYITESTPELEIASFGFKTEEEAELAIAIAKTLKVYKKEKQNMHSLLHYTWRILGLFEVDFEYQILKVNYYGT